MNDLVEFLRARLREDEVYARFAADLQLGIQDVVCGNWEALEHGMKPNIGFIHTTEAMNHIARQDPARVLREVEGKWWIVEQHSPIDHPGRQDYDPDVERCRTCAAHADGRWRRFTTPCPTLRLLALPYADHPDYDEEWRP